MPTENLVGEELLGKYRIESLLGSGIVGQVYRAARTDDGSAVAIKVLDERHRPDPNIVRRFLREAEAARTLDHPCIARTYECGSDEKGRPFVCSELVEGEPVTRAVGAGPLTLRRVIVPICETLSALSEAHRQGVLHRCLKPSNVLVTELPDGQFVTKVSDFGMGRLIKAVPGTATTKYGVACAAPEYMAPEQAVSVEIDGRADVYAAGVIFYELLTGRVPFQGSTPRETLSKHQHEPLVPIDEARPGRHCPKEIASVCTRALEKDPRQRFQSPREMRSALQSALELLGARADLPIEVQAASGPALHNASADRLTMPGEQIRSHDKVKLGAALLLIVCAVLWLSAPRDAVHEDPQEGGPIPATSQSAAQAPSTGAAQVIAQGKQRLDAGDLEGARALLAKAHDALGATAEVSRWLGETLVRAGDRERGEPLLRRYLALVPDADDHREVEALLAAP